MLWLHDYCDPGSTSSSWRAPDHDRDQGRARPRARRRRARDTSSSAGCSTAEQHPDADRLTRLHRSTLGEGDAAQIVCGAPNVAAGQTVAVARPGAVMPDGTKLKKAKLRGVESDGMILAEDELGDRHRPRRDHGARRRRSCRARRSTTCCRSRPTCSSSRSRRTGPTAWPSTASRARSTPPPARRSRRRRGGRRRPAGRRDPGLRRSRSQDPDLCPRFTARLFEDVKLGPSPAWLKARLMAAGQRPINNVVDITNYVMLLTGPAAARVRRRPRGRRPARRAPRARRRDDDHARRRRAHARRRRCCVIERRRRADVDRRA